MSLRAIAEELNDQKIPTRTGKAWYLSFVKTIIDRNQEQTKWPEDNMKSLVTIPATLAVLAVASGSLPWILFQVRKAQIRLIIESQTSKWAKAIT